MDINKIKLNQEYLWIQPGKFCVTVVFTSINEKEVSGHVTDTKSSMNNMPVSFNQLECGYYIEEAPAPPPSKEVANEKYCNCDIPKTSLENSNCCLTCKKVIDWKEVKSAEEILEKELGDMYYVIGKYRKNAINAMNIFAQQFQSTPISQELKEWIEETLKCEITGQKFYRLKLDPDSEEYGRSLYREEKYESLLTELSTLNTL